MAASNLGFVAFRCSDDCLGCCCLLEEGLGLGGSPRPRLVKLTFPKEGSLLNSSERVVVTPNMLELFDLSSKSLVGLGLVSRVGLKVHSEDCLSNS